MARRTERLPHLNRGAVGPFSARGEGTLADVLDRGRATLAASLLPIIRQWLSGVALQGSDQPDTQAVAHDEPRPVMRAP